MELPCEVCPHSNFSLQPPFEYRLFPAISISIGSRSTNGVSRWLGTGFVFPVSTYPSGTCFRRSRFPLVPGRPMGFRGDWALDSCFPHPHTLGERVCSDLDFHWFPVDQWGFEVIGHWIRVSRIHIPLGNVFAAISISIGSRSTNEVSRWLGTGFVFPASTYPWGTCLQRSRFLLVPGRPMRFRGDWALDSCFPYRHTFEEGVFGDLDFHWFPVDQWGFEVIGHWIRVSRIHIPLGNVFAAISISIGSRSTNGVSRWLGTGFVFPASTYPLGERVCSDLDFYWFPVDQWGFEVIGHWIRVSRIHIPLGNVFAAISISIGSRSTNGVSRWLGTGFVFPASTYPWGTCLQRSRFPLVPGRPMGFRGDWALDSCFPYRHAPGEGVFGDLDFLLVPGRPMGFRGDWALRFVFPVSTYPWGTCLQRSRFPLVPGRPMGFRGDWALDSCFPYRHTLGEGVFGDLDFYWFPVDQWGFEVIGHWIRVSRIHIPLGNVFAAISISIGSRSTNEVSRWLGTGFVFPVYEHLDFHWFPVDQWGFEVIGHWIRVSIPLRKVFSAIRFPLVPGRPMGFRGDWALYSCFPHPHTLGERVCSDLDFHWFPVDQWGFEVIGHWIRVSRIDMPLGKVFAAILISIGFWLVTFHSTSYVRTDG